MGSGGVWGLGFMMTYRELFIAAPFPFSMVTIYSPDSRHTYTSCFLFTLRLLHSKVRLSIGNGSSFFLFLTSASRGFLHYLSQREWSGKTHYRRDNMCSDVTLLRRKTAGSGPFQLFPSLLPADTPCCELTLFSRVTRSRQMPGDLHEFTLPSLSPTCLFRCLQNPRLRLILPLTLA